MTAIERRILKLRKEGRHVSAKNVRKTPTTHMDKLLRALLHGMNREEASAVISLLVDYRGQAVVDAWRQDPSESKP